MKDKSLNREKERLRRRLDNSGFVRAIGWNDNENMITGWTSFTVTLFFLNGHLPEVQQRVCGCVREYASLIGKEAKFYMSPVSSRLHLAKNGRIKLLSENDIRKVREKGGRRTVKFLMASHETMEEYNTVPPKLSLFVSLQLDIEDSEDEIPPERKVSMISAVFPPSFFLIDKQPLTFTDLVLKWSNALHPLSGTAGWGISQHSSQINFLVAQDTFAQELLRFPGLELPPLPVMPEDTRLFENHIAGINWLTVICRRFAEQVGGEKSLKALGREYPIARYDDGFIIQAGPKPELGDRKAKRIPAYYGKVHDLLRPLYPPPEELRNCLIGSVIDFDPFTKDLNRYSKEEEAQRSLDFYSRWMNRFSADTKMLPLYKKKKKVWEYFLSLFRGAEED